MTMDGYIDGIIGLLKKAGVTQAEILEKNVDQTLSHCFMKGVPFERAANDVCAQFDIEIGA